jgi:ABC-type multidrug transport system permease subunit
MRSGKVLLWFSIISLVLLLFVCFQIMLSHKKVEFTSSATTVLLDMISVTVIGFPACSIFNPSITRGKNQYSSLCDYCADWLVSSAD